KGTLLEYLDQTQTAMGGRTLKQWLVRPLTNLEKIKARHALVQFFAQESGLRERARETLKGALDLERILVRIFSGHANPRDVLGLKNTLAKGEKLKQILKASLEPPVLLKKILLELGDFG